MKRIILSAVVTAIVFLLPACSLFESPNKDKPAPEDKETPALYVPYSAEYIEVPEGYETLIYNDDVLVATCYHSGYVVLPRANARTRALDGYQVVTVPSSSSDSSVASENELEMVVAFEDMKVGDHDYNDFVFQAQMTITNAVSGGSTVKLDITPVAMGASLTLGLGVVLSDSEGNTIADNLITSDAREFFFNGDPNFINTNGIGKVYDTVGLTIKTNGSTAVAGISWYLVSRGEKLFASNHFHAYLDDAELPQGLVFMNLRTNTYYTDDGTAKKYTGNNFWQYPQERVYIAEVYPGFENAFLEGGDFSIFAIPTGSSFFDAICADADGCLSERCLYNSGRTGTVIVDTEDDDEDDPEPESAESYYDSAGNPTVTAQSISAMNDIYHNKENPGWALVFSTANGNAVNFARGDMIEAKVTAVAGGDFLFDLGYESGDIIELYTNGSRNWFRLQLLRGGQHITLENGKSFDMPVTARISKAGIELLINGQYELRLAASNTTMADILTLGTDTPLCFGIYGSAYSSVTFEYIKVIRNTAATAVQSVSVTPSSATLDVHGTVTLAASVTPANAFQDVTWSSSDSSVATVDASGVVTAKAEGTCTITAASTMDASKYGTCTITVNPLPETPSGPAGEDVYLLTDHTSVSTSVDLKTVEIIASGTPTATQICFNNGDFIEVKLHKNEIASADRDNFYLGSVKSEHCPYMIINSHPSTYSQIYCIPGYWWSTASIANLNVDIPLYARFGCKADGTRGCGSYSTDGVTWTDLTSSNDIESQWEILTDPSNTPLVIQSARNTGYVQSITYDYVKIVRSAAR